MSKSIFYIERVIYLSDEYIKKYYDVIKEKKRLKTFEAGCEFSDLYNFNKQLTENNMKWKELPQYGLIIHEPTGLTMRMGISMKTTARHKCYTLNKLKDRVRNTGTWTLNTPESNI